MIVLKANPDRGVELAGVPGLVPRPVDIDQTHTGFKSLRTLRIYRFEPPHVIDGHAEEDEVFIVVLAGTIELVMRSELWSSNNTQFVLTAANDRTHAACAAYLPPQAEYALTPHTSADIAYARARPSTSRPPAVFPATPRMDEAGTWVLLDEAQHAERLRIRLLHVGARPKATALNPLQQSDHPGEALMHVKTTPAHGAAKVETSSGPACLLESGDTIAVGPGECPTLRLAAGSSATILVAEAS